MTTIEDIDARLTACCEAFKDAIDTGDLDTADAMSLTMDELLDARSHARLGDENVYPT